MATENIGNILKHALEHSEDRRAVVIFDTESELANIVTEGYRNNLPNGEFIDFASMSAESILAKIEELQPKDLVVLVQSTNFRLNEFRIRIELFKRELKAIEHVHLNRMSEDQKQRYIESLAYDPAYYRGRGQKIKELIDNCTQIVVECPGTKLVYDSPFETARLNVGDYSQMKNVGGTYPIGEVFSEPSDLSKVNGEVKLFGFAGKDHILQEHEPFTAIIKDGILSAPDAPDEFKEILAMIEEKGPVLVREFGAGLNAAIGRGKPLNDVTAFERMLGLHMSLGAKHSIYKKPGLPRNTGGYHIDVFLDLERITIDDTIIFENGDYTI